MTRLHVVSRLATGRRAGRRAAAGKARGTRAAAVRQSIGHDSSPRHEATGVTYAAPPDGMLAPLTLVAGDGASGVRPDNAKNQNPVARQTYSWAGGALRREDTVKGGAREGVASAACGT